MDLFFSHTQEIREYLKKFLEEQETQLKEFVWSQDMFPRVTNFCQEGKAIRGNSVLFVGQMSKQTNISDILPVAAAIELFHGSMLMQDDVTDNDLLRRGKPSMHAQYMHLLPNKHLAESFAFYTGDIGYFLSFGMINRAHLSAEKKQDIITTLSEELVKVGLGQMQDIYVPGGIPTLETILTTYRTKTARYTFSLPFLLGAICADLPQKDRKNLEQLGEHLGIIFQLKDDLLDLFGTEDTIGKPIGSDIREGKYTPIILSLLQRIQPEEKEVFEVTFGNTDASPEYVKAIIELIQFYGISAEIETMMQLENKKAQEILEVLPVAQEYKEVLQKLFIYNLTRQK